MAEDETIDFLEQGISVIGNKILNQAEAASELPMKYRNLFKAYLRDALKIVDQKEKEQQDGNKTV